MAELFGAVLFVDFCRFMCGEESAAIDWILDQFGV